MQLLLDILAAEEHCHQSFKHLIKEARLASNLTDPSSPNNEEEEETTNDRQEDKDNNTSSTPPMPRGG